MTVLRQTTWRIPILLVLLGVMPIAASIYRTVVLATTDLAAVTDADELRFFDMPVPILMHVIFGSLFLVLGALQMSPGLRRKHRILHRRIGWSAAVSAIIFSLYGVWMVFLYPSHSAASFMIDIGRVVFGIAIPTFVVLGVLAAIRKNIPVHRAWMIRGYSLAAASGIQSYLIAVATGLMGRFDPQIADAMMILGWMIGIIAAEKIIAGPRTKKTAAT
ncbi:DUF2306 domain-containing protein [Cognatishimia activa]|uniref:DUF2306 domain-containing protein n=1 Tax=Cognatishimia activa TaxID=1715691 RepID=A0A0N7MBP8_9RHOB|nr:DUF2306 domain-containing protein [Cognatishimia activa]CUJ06490.1 hypothetical protein TA5113_02212 [Cognatishimia activa]CUK26008.1 hypothetical protein TA5114_01814 [Cognatishimia activa]